MEDNKKEQGTNNEIARVNRFALTILTIIDFFLVAGYMREGIAGNISRVFAGVFCRLGYNLHDGILSCIF